MKRVEKEVPGRVNDGAWNLEKDPFVPAEPRRPKLARPDEPANPRPIVGRNSRGCDVWLLHSKQGEVGRNIVRRGVDRDLKRCRIWILAEICCDRQRAELGSANFPPAFSPPIPLRSRYRCRCRCRLIHKSTIRCTSLLRSGSRSVRQYGCPCPCSATRGGSAFQSSRPGLREPSQCAPRAAVNSLGGRENSDDRKLTIRLFARQLFAAGTRVLEGSEWNDYLVDLRTLKVKGREALDDGCPEPALDDARRISDSVAGALSPSQSRI
jgi:hypothetical protein